MTAHADRDRSEQPIVSKPIPRPCRGCGVGEAEQHIDDCPAVIEALEQHPKWADLFGAAPDMTEEQFTGETTEHRIVCDTCGQTMGLSHKGCDGRWVREARTVTAWRRVPSEPRPGVAP